MTENPDLASQPRVYQMQYQQRLEDEQLARQGSSKDSEQDEELLASTSASASEHDLHQASLVVHDFSQADVDGTLPEAPRSPLRPLALPQQQSQQLYSGQRTPTRFLQRGPLPQPPRSRFASSPMGGYDAGTMGFDYNRGQYASPHSAGFQPTSAVSLPYGPNARRDVEMGRSLSAGLAHSPGASAPRFFVTVLPPADLVRTPAHNRHAPSAGSSALRRGALMPLYPTLGAQLYAISREYGLPSIGGLSIFLTDDGEGNPGPRISEETWPFLWGRYFDRGADELYNNLTMPATMPTPVAASPSSSPFAHADYSSTFAAPIDGLPDTSDHDGSQEALPVQAARQVPSSGSRSGRASRNASRAHMRPPSQAADRAERARATSAMSIASHASPAMPMSRVPIIAKIEWAVDPMRAPWWNQWSGQAAQSTSDLSSSSMQAPTSTDPQYLPRPNGLSKKRSLRLPQLRSTTTTPRSVSAPTRQDSETTDQEHMTSERSEPIASERSVASHDYAPLADEAYDLHEDAEDRLASGGQQLVASGSSSTIPASLTPQRARLLSVEEDSESRVPSEIASNADRATVSSPRNIPLPGLGLSVGEGRAAGTRKRGMTVSRSDESALRRASPPERGNMTVREWISKTAPPATPRAEGSNGTARGLQASGTNDSITSSEYDALLAEEQLLPPENDFEEVLGLWKQKAISVEGVPVLPEGPVASGSAQRSSIASAATLEEPTSTARSSRVLQRQSLASLAPSEEVAKPASVTSQTSRSEQSVALEVADANGDTTAVPGAEERDVVPTMGDDVLDAAAPSASLASLRSPIALQEDTTSFEGPRPETITNESSMHSQGLTVPWHTSTTDSEAVRADADTHDLAISTSHEDGMADATNGSSSDHLALPLQGANLKRSDSTASSAHSDSLIDMERALELLSPAVASESTPNLDDTTDSKWSKTRTTPRLSASESMQRARVISASVSPHPNWFRARSINASDGSEPPLPVSRSMATVSTLNRASLPAEAAPQESEAEDEAERPQSTPPVPKATTHKRSQSRFSAEEIMAAAAASNQLKQRLSMEPSSKEKPALSQRQSTTSMATSTSLYSVNDLVSYDEEVDRENNDSKDSGYGQSNLSEANGPSSAVSNAAQEREAETSEARGAMLEDSTRETDAVSDVAPQEAVREAASALPMQEANEEIGNIEQEAAYVSHHPQPSSYYEAFDDPALGARSAASSVAKTYTSPATADSKADAADATGLNRSQETEEAESPLASAAVDDGSHEQPSSFHEMFDDPSLGAREALAGGTKIYHSPAISRDDSAPPSTKSATHEDALPQRSSTLGSHSDAETVSGVTHKGMPDDEAEEHTSTSPEIAVSVAHQDTAEDESSPPLVSTERINDELLVTADSGSAHVLVTSPSQDSLVNAQSAEDVFTTPAQTPNPPREEGEGYMGAGYSTALDAQGLRSSLRPTYSTIGVQVQSQGPRADDSLYSQHSTDDFVLTSLDTSLDTEQEEVPHSPPPSFVSTDIAAFSRDAERSHGSEVDVTSDATPSTAQPARFATRGATDGLLSPKMPSTEFENRSSESLTAFARLIRGDSFSDTQESSNSSSIDERVVAAGATDSSPQEGSNNAVETEEPDDHGSGDETQLGRGHSQNTTDTTISDAATTRESAVPSLDRWSTDSREDADSENEGADIEDEGEQDADSESRDSLALSSHLSTRSQSGNVSELSGLRTPTFYYDNQLTGDEAGSRYSGSQRVSSYSGSQAASRNSPMKGMSRSSSSQPGQSLSRPSEALSPLSASFASSEGLSSHDERLPSASLQGSQGMGEGFEAVPTANMTPSSLSMPHLGRPTDYAREDAQLKLPASQSSSKTAAEHIFAESSSPPRARRSLGALIERKRKSLGVRRASASNPSSGAQQHQSPSVRQPGHVITLTEPTPPRGVPMASDGTALPAFRGAGTASPRRRFGVLPPSPSLVTTVPRVASSMSPADLGNSSMSPAELGPPTQNGRVVPWMHNEGYFAGHVSNGSPSKPVNSNGSGRLSMASPRAKQAIRNTPSSYSEHAPRSQHMHDDDPFRANYASADDPTAGAWSSKPIKEQRSTDSVASNRSSSRGTAFAFAGATTSPDLARKARIEG